MMIAEGFTGQGMLNREKAADYICLAANNPNVDQELPLSGVTFWKHCKWEHKVWKARKKFGLPEK